MRFEQRASRQVVVEDAGHVAVMAIFSRDGFVRFVRLDLVEPNSDVTLKAVRAVFLYRDLPYVTNGHAQQKLDLYLPKDGKNLPLIIYIHGGGWQSGEAVTVRCDDMSSAIQRVAQFADDLEVNKLEWNSYSPKAGWALKVKKGSRTILYMAPCDDAIRVAFILGDKAKQSALRSDLPERFVKMIRQAKKYPEGTAVRIETKSAADLVVIYKLAIAKLEN